MTQTNQSRFTTVITAVLVSWFLLALSASWFGVFSDPQRPPLLLGAAAVVPVLIFAAWYVRSEALRRFIVEIALRALTMLQTGRVAGVLFVMLYLRGLLPGVFALPAGWGDIAIGATAPLAAWFVTAQRDFRREVFVWWNVLGILDLVVAVTLGVLASPAFSAGATGPVTTELMAQFPLSLVPTFFVPLYLILHIISLGRVHSLHSATTQLA